MDARTSCLFVLSRLSLWRRSTGTVGDGPKGFGCVTALRRVFVDLVDAVAKKVQTLLSRRSSVFIIPLLSLVSFNSYFLLTVMSASVPFALFI